MSFVDTRAASRAKTCAGLDTPTQGQIRIGERVVNGLEPIPFVSAASTRVSLQPSPNSL